MTEETDLLYARLLSETAAINWSELEPFFARGVVLHVASSINLVEVAQAVAEDNKASVSVWIEQQQLGALSAEQASLWQSAQPDLWAVVVAPWVLVQERKKALH